MDQQQKTRRFGIFVILCSCILRLAVSGVPEAAGRWLTDKSGILYPVSMETGQNVRFSASSEKNWSHFRESPAPWFRQPEKPVFSPEDLKLVDMDYDCTLRPDLEALLQQPLDWDLTGGAPAVLILHTHTTESYTKAGETYQETSAYRTLDEQYNMLSIGDAVAEALESRGIRVIHDRQIHDYPSYNGSYVHARAAIQKHLEENPAICLVLDLHRDALEKDGKQLRLVTQSDETACAQLMMVVGTDVSRQAHINWQENLALALKLHIQLQRLAPGIMRPLNLRAQRFNQDLSPGALLIEVGTAGNTHAEALAAAGLLAEAVAALAQGGGTA